MVEIKLLQETKKSQLAQQIISDIRSGEYLPGTSLPRQDSLTQKYQVSGPTLRKVLNVLTSQGMLVKTPQGGIVVPVQKTFESENSRVTVRQPEKTKISIAAFWAAQPDFHFVGIQKGITRYAEEAGLEFKIFLSTSGHEKVLEALRSVDTCQIDGMLAFPYNHPEYISALNDLVSQKFPVVCVDRRVGNVPVSAVQADNATGIYEATHYLIEKYHRPVYLLSGPQEHSTNISRYQGYKQAMGDAGFEDLVDNYSHFFGTSDQDTRYWPMDKKSLNADSTARKLLDEIEAFPASVVCYNDYTARRLYLMAEERGLVVGKDLYVVGFDDLPLARFLKPSLTTVRQPRERIGYEAAKLLHQLICGKINEPIDMHLPVEFVARDSA
jgi:LacI family transcriptional regulator